jgi:hypothetical protein
MRYGLEGSIEVLIPIFDRAASTEARKFLVD